MAQKMELMMAVNGTTNIPKIAANMMITISSRIICVVHVEVFFHFKIITSCNMHKILNILITLKNVSYLGGSKDGSGSGGSDVQCGIKPSSIVGGSEATAYSLPWQVALVPT